MPLLPPLEPEGRLGNKAGGSRVGTVEAFGSLQSVLCVARLRKYIGFRFFWIIALEEWAR